MRHARFISIWLLLPAMACCLAILGIPRASAQPRHRRLPSKSASPRRSSTRTKAGGTQRKQDPLSAGLRDPFAPLLSSQGKPIKQVVRPPGKAGLMIEKIDIQGVVRGPHGAVAVVSNPEGHVYFLRPGDRLFDGTVERIDLNDVVFIEHARDAFGRKFTRRVTKAVQPPEGAKR